MKKILIITYYWPPSGGAGVQRWLKFAKYLPEFGWQPIVLTVDEDDATYPVLDKSLQKEVENLKIEVHKTKSREVLQLYAKLFGKSKLPQGGGANSNKQSLKSKLEHFIRGNFFIPDPRKGWNKYAYRKAVELINEKKIDVVVTTSPPHSTQLIGLKLKQNLNIKWIADLRDPWTSIYHYDEMRHTYLARQKDKTHEENVLKFSDEIITVGDSLRNEFKNISKRNNIHVITNGYDEDDFNKVEKLRSKKSVLRIVYTGTMSDKYNFNVFLEALKNINEEVQVDFYGNISPNIKQFVSNLKLQHNVVFHEALPHNDSIKQIVDADLLLLVIPQSKNDKSILTGKLFEYLAAKKPILCIGPKDGDAAKIIHETNSGVVFEKDEHEQLLNWMRDFVSGESSKFTFLNVEKYSRRELTKKMIKILE